MNDTLKNMIGGSLAGINIKDSLDLVKYKDRIPTLANICSKVMYGGTLELEGVDLEDIIRSSYRGDIFVEEFNEIMCECESVSTMFDVIKALEDQNFKIITKRRNFSRYYIKAQRKVQE